MDFKITSTVPVKLGILWWETDIFINFTGYLEIKLIIYLIKYMYIYESNVNINKIKIN